MRLFATALVTDYRRAKAADRLSNQLNPDVVNVNKGHWSAAQNHWVAWSELRETGREWGVVLEDDALPVQHFRRQATMALSVAPAPIVSFYLGRNRPPHWQDSISKVIGSSANFILGPELLHGVGYAVRADLIHALLRNTEDAPHFNEAVSDWARRVGLKIAYTNPSLVDHDFRQRSLIEHQPTRWDETVAGSVPRGLEPPGWERRAWKLGERDTWTPTVIRLPEPHMHPDSRRRR